MRITNHANLPDAIVQAVKNDPYPLQDTGDISVTRLIDAPQIRVLRERHRDEIEEDAADRIWSLLGQVAHGILERAETVAMTEQRLFANVAGWRVSGQFDRLAVLPDGTLQDYKVTSVWAVINGVKADWLHQLNCLRWLAEQNGHPVRRLQIVAILRDWSRGKALGDANYPQRQVKVLDVPVWTLQEAGDYIRERVRLHQAADDGLVPECSPEERWERPTTYAVMRRGRKSALRVFDRLADARDLANEPDRHIEVRPGRAVRCEEYCPVAQFCPQRRAELAEIERAAAGLPPPARTDAGETGATIH
jgi:hypothetical protein